MNYSQFISQQTRFYKHSKLFTLELGGELSGVQIAYRTFGQLNAACNNAILVCHALTGSSDVDVWWSPLLGLGKALDPTQDFIVCSNILGSCYGTTGPTSINPKTGDVYGASFPSITIMDMVRLQNLLIEWLGIQTIKLVIGGSLGGMQVLEWALLYPKKVKAIVPIATSGRHSAWCIGFNETQRQAIYTDSQWQGGNYPIEKQPEQGLAVARMIGMNSYRSWVNFSTRFGRNFDIIEDKDPQFAMINYLQYHGKKLVKRFDANTYITLTHAMDRHDLSHHSINYESALRSIQQPALIVGITSDLLYPIEEQKELANLIPNAKIKMLDSTHGHDAFLIDLDQLNDLVVNFRHNSVDFYSYDSRKLNTSSFDKALLT